MAPRRADNPPRSAQETIQPPEIPAAADRFRVMGSQRIQDLGNNNPPGWIFSPHKSDFVEPGIRLDLGRENDPDSHIVPGLVGRIMISK
jgi:hypothetical protein